MTLGFLPVPPFLDSCSSDNFRTIFWIWEIFSFLAGVMTRTYRLPAYQMRFCCILVWAWSWIPKVKYGICYISARLPRNEIKILIELYASNVIIGLELGYDLELVKVNYGLLLYLSSKNSDCHETKTNISVELYASNATNGIALGHDLDLEFSKIK